MCFHLAPSPLQGGVDGARQQGPLWGLCNSGGMSESKSQLFNESMETPSLTGE